MAVVAVVLLLIVLPLCRVVHLMPNTSGLTGFSHLRGGRYTVDMQLFNSISCVSEATFLIFPRTHTGRRCCGCGHGGRVCFQVVGADVPKTSPWDGDGAVEPGLRGSSSSQGCRCTSYGFIPAWTRSLPWQITLICRLSRSRMLSHYHVLLASGILSELHNRIFCFLKHFLLSLIMLRFPVHTASCNYHLQISGYAKLFLKGIFFVFCEFQMTKNKTIIT